MAFRRSTMKIISIVGARPNFMKIAPLIDEFSKHPKIDSMLLHTGQHYDGEMSRVFFEQLGLPRPDIDLGVAPGPQAAQTAEIMQKTEQIFLLSPRADLIIVVGDVNSTLACALTAVKLHIPVAHIEAGLRSFKWEMPEEINRVLTDRLSDYLFTTEKDAEDNLVKEGISKDRIYFVGNTMIDTLIKHKKESDKSTILEELKLKPQEYILLTLHRQELVSNEKNLKFVIDTLNKIQKKIKIIWPLHPRTNKNLKKFKLLDQLKSMSNIKIIKSQSYLDFLRLMSQSKCVLTDSGGVQEETTVLGVDCLTLRGETERPITVTLGTNTVVDSDKEKIFAELDKILSGKGKSKNAKIPPLWDGKSAERIIKIILRKHNK